MRANHATEPPQPAHRGVAGARCGIARCGIARWLPGPRTVAAAGALLAQLWGLGAPGAYAATADPLREPPPPAVRRAPRVAPALDGPALDGPALDGPALDRQPAERPAGPGQSAAEAPGRSPGGIGEPTGGGRVAGATGAVGDGWQERIRSGGLPLPGQRAAVPDAFAIASGLLDSAPAQDHPAEALASREGEPAGPPSADRPRSDGAHPTVPRQREAAEPPPVLEASDTAPTAGTSADRDGTTAPAALARPGDGGTPETLAVADTATVTTVGDGSATATAVLAPIAAGLLLTGAAMCKHRGLPRGH
ncbi:hypothetical protein [Kitasatospora sp. NPDC086791]|uniref:hypothetical protein n=1 Tax=Kitasatospora sp. NPDC086791 TaxID=3155178 RepID=UPI00341C21DF